MRELRAVLEIALLFSDSGSPSIGSKGIQRRNAQPQSCARVARGSAEPQLHAGLVGLRVVGAQGAAHEGVRLRELPEDLRRHGERVSVARTVRTALRRTSKSTEYSATTSLDSQN